MNERELEVKQTMNAMIKAKRALGTTVWKLARKLSSFRLRFDRKSWPEAMKLIDMSPTQVRKYIRIGKNEQRIRELIFARGEMADELSLNRLIGFASMTRKRTDEQTSKLSKMESEFVETKNRMTIWIAENKNIPKA